MKYLTWSVYFPGGSGVGSTPEAVIRSRGYEADGLFHIGPFEVLGVASQDADISGLDEFNVHQIASEQALGIALSFDATATLDDELGLRFAPFTKI